jgi:hypothetical protein
MPTEIGYAIHPIPLLLARVTPYWPGSMSLIAALLAKAGCPPRSAPAPHLPRSAVRVDHGLPLSEAHLRITAGLEMRSVPLGSTYSWKCAAWSSHQEQGITPIGTFWDY